MFQVVWLQSALNDLAGAWTQADSSLRQAITQAARAFELQLLAAPEEQGESRAGDRRVVFYPPLAITFEVDAQRLLVRVIHVNCFRPRGS